MADIRETAKAEAERRWPEWRHLRDSWDAVGMQAAFKQGAEWAWKSRGEADAEAVRRVHKSRSVQVGSQTHGGGPQYGDACTHCRVLWPCPTIRALDEEDR